jgi:hypothetical protein
MRQVALPREVYTGSSNQLFDFLAQALADFIQEQEKVKLISIVMRMPGTALRHADTSLHLLAAYISGRSNCAAPMKPGFCCTCIHAGNHLRCSRHTRTVVVFTVRC